MRWSVAVRNTVSQFLYFRTASGRHPSYRSRSHLSIGLKTRSLRRFRFSLEGSPTIIWVSRLWGLPRSTLSSPKGSSLWHFQATQDSESLFHRRQHPCLLPAPSYTESQDRKHGTAPICIGHKHSGHRSPGESGLSSTDRLPAHSWKDRDGSALQRLRVFLTFFVYLFLRRAMSTYGGGGGIRTPVGREALTVFKTAPL